MTNSATSEPYRPLIARTRTIHRPVGPVAYDCVKLIIVRDGSAILFSEGGEHPINIGDVVLLYCSGTLINREKGGWLRDCLLHLDTSAPPLDLTRRHLHPGR